MATSYEQISNGNSSSSQKTDANLAQDSNYLGGIAAEYYATKQWVKEYHGAKEKALTEYIDEQDANNLATAKEYANTLVRNIDFSPYAKLTDLDSVKETLETECANNLATAESYTDTQVAAVVSDVNDNFEDVNTAISTLNADMTEVFQSVSEGKELIADAITDKGVETSADDSYSTMATNISKIVTSEIPDGYVYTGDATATADKIINGYTAYVNGEKIWGTYLPYNYNSTNVTTPTYGTDTSDATATAGDILAGKTAYVNGVKLTGTLSNTTVYVTSTGETNLSITEIYGLSGDNYQTNEVYNYGGSIARDVSKDGTCIVFAANETDDDGNVTGRYIYSYSVVATLLNDSLYYQISHSTTSDGDRKYQYSYAELGLDPDTDVDYICIGNPGFNGQSDEALLCITQGTKAHFYMFDYGGWHQIGYNERFAANETEWEWTVDFDSELSGCTIIAKPAAANTDSRIFGLALLVMGGLGNISHYQFPAFVTIDPSNDYEMYINISSVRSTDYYIKNPLKCKFSPTDKYFSVMGTQQYNSTTYYISATQIWYLKITNGTYQALCAKKTSAVAFTADDNYVWIIGAMYSISATSSSISITSATSSFLTETDVSYGIYDEYVSPDNQYLYIVTSTHIYIYEIDTSATENWSQKDLLYFVNSTIDIKFSDDRSLISDVGSTYFNLNINSLGEEVIGIKYKGNNYYKNFIKALTASASDVLSGETFIGYNGTPETGTLVISSTSEEETTDE